MNKKILIFCALTITCIIGWKLTNSATPPEIADAKQNSHPQKTPTKVSASTYTAIATQPLTQGTKDEGPLPERANYGTTPQTPKKFLGTAVGKSVIEAHSSPETFPERLSPMVTGKKFDAERWKNNEAYRNDYLTVIEPSRALNSSSNPKAPLLQMACRPHQEVRQGEKITLTAKAIPGAPVSFYSPHLNRFENGFTSITTIANADGLASVVMEGMPGTIARTDVTCASPLCAGRVVFRVTTLQGDTAK